MLNRWKRKNECPCGCIRASDNGRLPLASAPEGKPVKVCSIAGGRALCGRMAAMGIYPGAEIELLCGGCNCPCLVRVHGSTLSLGAGVSQKIMVTPAG